MKKAGGDSEDSVGAEVPEPVTVRAQIGTAKPVRNPATLEVSRDAIRTLPADFVQRHRVLPYKILDATIYVATASPGNQRVIDDIRLLTGLEVVESAMPAAQILERIAESYQVTVERMIENLSPGHGANGEGRESRHAAAREEFEGVGAPGTRARSSTLGVAVAAGGKTPWTLPGHRADRQSPELKKWREDPDRGNDSK